MRAPEVVVHVVERDHHGVVSDLLGEPVGQASKAAHPHSHGQVLTLDVGRGDQSLVGVARNDANVDGVTVEYRRADGSIAGAQARVIDFDVPENDDWFAVNQFTVAEGQHTRRPDVVLFVNGLPLAPGGHPLRSVCQ